MHIKKTSVNKKRVISCGDKILNLEEARIMGILNLTDDSFYDGGKYNNADKYIARAAELIECGAHIIDIGAASTRPGAKLISDKEEWEVLQKPLDEIRKHFPDIIISVDTYNASQIRKCADAGVNIINDISGGSWDENMFTEISKYQMAYVLMHIKGQPDNMQKAPVYHSVTNEVQAYFKSKIDELEALGFSNIILDPGFGFGKDIEHNYELLANLKELTTLDYPVLVGLSRKSMVFKVLNNTAKESLNGTTVLNTLALQNGAQILRVHDVKEASETIKLFGYYCNNVT